LSQANPPEPPMHSTTTAAPMAGRTHCGQPSGANGAFGSLSAALLSKGVQHTGLLLWLGGLGNDAAEFEELYKPIASEMPWLQWLIPDAPFRPVTYLNGEQKRCWFDMPEDEVREGQRYAGLEESKARVHGLMREAEALGFAAGRIVLGGFSQGAVIALWAGLTFERPVAGICAFAPWVTGGLPQAIRHPNTPILIGSGDEDNIVPISRVREDVQRLREAGCSSVRFVKYAGLPHWFVEEEINTLRNFLLEKLGNLAPQKPTSPLGSAPRPAQAAVPVGPSLRSVPTPTHVVGYATALAPESGLAAIPRVHNIQASRSFSAGSAVVITGLRKSPHLNGRSGVIRQLDPAGTGRWMVQVLFPGRTELKAIRAENLRLEYDDDDVEEGDGRQ